MTAASSLSDVADTVAARRLGLGLVLASTVAWSATGLFTRALDLPVWTLLAWRGIFGGAGLLAVILQLEGRAGLLRFGRLGRPGLIYAAIMGSGMLLYITALERTTVAHVTVIYAIAPLLAAGLGWLALGQRPGPRAVLASLGALAGVAIMMGLGREGRLAGDLMAVGMTVAMAVMLIMARRFPGLPVLQAACLASVGSGLVALPFGNPFDVAAPDLPMLAAFGMISNALGFGLFALGSRHLAPVTAALVSALDAPLGPFWVWLVFAEAPSPATLAGAALVMVAVLWHVWSEPASGPPGSGPPASGPKAPR